MTKKKAALLLIGTVVACIVTGSVYKFYGVRVDARIDTSSCPLSSPLRIDVTNYTFTRLASASIALEAWRGGRSQNTLSTRHFSYDVVTAPFAMTSGCVDDPSFEPPQVSPSPAEIARKKAEDREAEIAALALRMKRSEEFRKIIMNPASSKDEVAKAVYEQSDMDIAALPQSPAEMASNRRALDDATGNSRRESFLHGIQIVVREVEPEFY